MSSQRDYFISPFADSYLYEMPFFYPKSKKMTPHFMTLPTKNYVGKTYARLIAALLSTCWLALACDSSPKSDWAQGRPFHADVWKKDKLGCQGHRAKLAAEFDSIRRNLRGMSQDQILKVLGNPDFQNLQTRNQKLYIYFVEKGEQCQHAQADSRARTVAIRFNAIGYATEITYQPGKP